MCLPAEPPEMIAVGAPAGQIKQVGHQHGLFRLVGERKSCWRLSLMGAEPAAACARAQATALLWRPEAQLSSFCEQIVFVLN